MSPAFGHGVEDLIFTTGTSGSMEGLGMSLPAAYPTSLTTYSNISSPQTRVSSKMGWQDTSMMRDRSFTAPPPGMLPPTPQTATLPPSLMSHSAGTPPQPNGTIYRPGKRLRPDDQYETGRSPQRRRSASNNLLLQMPGNAKAQAELSEEDHLLLKLKHEESLPWKDIAKEFETRLGRSYQVPALQMRHKRLRERLRTWTEDDVAALEAAYDYWEDYKFEIVSQKVGSGHAHGELKGNKLTDQIADAGIRSPGEMAGETL
jgi:hypothetical protein